MFVMLSVRTTSVCERHNKVTSTTTTTTTTTAAANTTTTTTTSKATNTQITQTTPNQESAVSSLTTTFDNLLINKNSIEKIFTKSVSFDKNINQSNISLTQPNNLKEPTAQQVSDRCRTYTNAHGCDLHTNSIHLFFSFRLFLVLFAPS